MDDSFLVLFIVFIVIVVLGSLANHMDEELKKKYSVTGQPKEKKCPPHKWAWEEQAGMEGTFFIRCQTCRRLPSLATRDTS